MKSRPPFRSLTTALSLLAVAFVGAAPLDAATVALAVEESGCTNLADLDVPQAQLLPNCSLIPVAGPVTFPDILGVWTEGDGFGAIARDFFGTEGVFVAHFPSLAQQDLGSAQLVGTQGADLVLPAGLGTNPEVRDATTLGDGTVVLLVEDQNTGIYWVTELDTATGVGTPLAAVDPDTDSSFEGGIADLGGGEVLVSLFAGDFGPALYAVELAGGAVDRLGIAIRAGLVVGSPISLAARPDGTGFVWTSDDNLIDLVVEPTANGRRGRFTGSRLAGRDQWYQDSFSSPSLAFLAPGAGPAGCVRDGETLCLLEDRFQVSVDWDTGGATGSGIAVQTTADGGEFYFFSPNNIEMLVKVLDGCAINDNVWVFAAATTTVAFELRVEDTVTGAVRTYLNPQGTPAVTRTDTEAFPGGCSAAPAVLPTDRSGWVAEALRLKRQHAATSSTR